MNAIFANFNIFALITIKEKSYNIFDIFKWMDTDSI